MDWFHPKYRRNPNEKIHSMYSGVANGARTVTSVVRVAQDGNHLQTDRSFGPLYGRGQGGLIGVFVLGGLETTLDEMEYIIQARKEKKYVPQRTSGEVADMCRLLNERRNETIKYFRKNPSEAPKKNKVRRYLPAGCRLVPTSEPGLQLVEKR